MRYWIGLISIGCSAFAFAAEHVGSTEHAEPHPMLSADGSWVPVMLIVIGAMFLAAAVIGPVVRANAPELSPAPAHDEPPGASHHHGRSGTHNPEPEDQIRHGH